MSAVLKTTVMIGVPSAEIDEWWPILRDLVRKPLDRTGAIHDWHPDDVKEAIHERDMQCWVVHDGDAVVCVAITQVLQFPQRKVLGIPFVGAVSGSYRSWINHLGTIKEFARQMGCSAIRGWGRKGWEKALSPDVVRIEFDIEV